jgi:hypothetical protein
MEQNKFRKPVVVTDEKSEIDKDFSGTVVLVDLYKSKFPEKPAIHQVAAIHQYENGVLSGPSYDFDNDDEYPFGSFGATKTETTEDKSIPPTAQNYKGGTNFIHDFKVENYQDNPEKIFDEVKLDENIEFLIDATGNPVERRVMKVPGSDTHHILIEISEFDRMHGKSKINIYYKKDGYYNENYNQTKADRIVNFDDINKPAADKLREALSKDFDFIIFPKGNATRNIQLDENIKDSEKSVLDFLEENKKALDLNKETTKILGNSSSDAFLTQGIDPEYDNKLKAANLEDLKAKMDAIVESMNSQGVKGDSSEDYQSIHMIKSLFDELGSVDTNYPESIDMYIKDFYNGIEPLLSDETADIVGNHIIKITNLVPDHGGDKIKNTFNVIFGDADLDNLDERLGSNRRLMGGWQADVENEMNARTLIDIWLNKRKHPEMRNWK